MPWSAWVSADAVSSSVRCLKRTFALKVLTFLISTRVFLFLFEKVFVLVAAGLFESFSCVALMTKYSLAVFVCL